MKISYNFCKNLLNDLTCIAVEAQGGIPCKETVETASRYSKEKFLEIMKEFEILCGEKWEIEVGD